MDVTIVNQPNLRVAGIRHIGPYDQIGKAFGSLSGLLKGPAPAGAKFIALFHDDPTVTAADRLRSDAAWLLPANTNAPDGLIEQHVPAGKYAKTIHAGGYETLPQAWRGLLEEWLPGSGQRKRAGANYEIYLNTPMDTPKEQLRTELYVPIA
jgi:AraC family transcriptional regulator